MLVMRTKNDMSHSDILAISDLDFEFFENTDRDWET